MIRRTIGLAFLALVLPAWTQVGGLIVPPADKIANSIATEPADKNLEVARYYIGRGDFAGALHRLMLAALNSPTFSHTEEILARLAETYLAVGITSEARTAAAVVARKFPNGDRTAQALATLKSAGLEPAEDENSWISRTFK